MKIENLIKAVKNNDDIEKGTPLSASRILMYNHDLRDSGFLVLPEDFQEMIKVINGLWHDGAVIYAAEPEDTLFEDVLEMNFDFNLAEKEHLLILGEDENDWLVYNNALEMFQVVDSEDFTVWAEYPDFSSAAARLLKI